MSRNFCLPQTAYMRARALYDVCYAASRKHDKVMDAECEKLGIATPYGILPDGHPLLAEAQRLLDQENGARTLMYAAAHNLFDWATETTLAKHGTDKQKAEVRAMVAEMKTKAHVERFFIEFVDLCMRLDETAKPAPPARSPRMMGKLAILAVLLLMAFAASDATTSHKSEIKMIYLPQPNGDYRLFLFGSDRTLVCEEQHLKIVEQGDAVNPVVIECKH